jgi:outer membrane protein OmpA-like peptidoglycan-associated protein
MPPGRSRAASGAARGAGRDRSPRGTARAGAAGGLGLLLALCLVACAAPKPAPPKPVELAAPKPSVFLLLADPDGRTGQITVSNRGGTQVLDQPGQATRVAAPDQAPTAPAPMDEAEVRRVFGDALAAQPGEPARFILYFIGDSDDLTPDSLALLPAVAQSIRDRRAGDVGIVGHTDTRGSREYNYRLGLRRATRVANLLVARGVDRALLDLDSHGKDDLLVPTGDGVNEPRNRRVEITVR